MKYEHEFEMIENGIDELRGKLVDLNDRARIAANTTHELLELASTAGYNAIVIGVSHEAVPRSVSYTFGPHGSVFAAPNCRTAGTPDIWRICSSLGIAYGCGNGEQHQVKTEQLLEGAYEYRDGEWSKVDSQ